MVRVLIDLRRTIARRQLAASSPAAVWALALVAAASAVATLMLGWVTYPDPGTAIDVLALVGALWLGARLAQCALSGEPVLRPEMFAVLPLERRRLGGALLLVGLLDPASVLLALALTAIVPVGVRLAPAAAVTAVAALVLTVMLASVLATLVAGLLGPGAGRGRDAGTVLTALVISLLAVAGTLLPALVSVLERRSGGLLSELLLALPSGWGPRAVAAAGRSDLVGALVPLAALALSIGLVVLIWPSVLDRRMHTRRAGRRAAVWAGRRRSLLGRGAVSAVAQKELRLWLRDPIRLTCLLISLVVGTATCVLPAVTSGFDSLEPFGGALTVLIAGACACNLYGNDGVSLWLTIMTPGAASADVRGRQLAWLLLVGPYAALATVVLSIAGGSTRCGLWAGALTAALLGGGAGVAAVGSVIWVQPLDDAGSPTPAWSLKVHLVLIVVAATAAPTVVAILLAGARIGLIVGALSGIALGPSLGSRAAGRLSKRQLEILDVLSGGSPT